MWVRGVCVCVWVVCQEWPLADQPLSVLQDSGECVPVPAAEGNADAPRDEL
eukprot:m.7440 g.7440  ORF g.7440 m.7440 type:complete len:51 (-) comp2753_c0_seq2:64-216(-)